jgi:hypothetical protein
LPEFHIGDCVEIICKDGATFNGFLEDFGEGYVILSGLGYALDDIITMQHTVF